MPPASPTRTTRTAPPTAYIPSPAQLGPGGTGEGGGTRPSDGSFRRRPSLRFRDGRAVPVASQPRLFSEPHFIGSSERRPRPQADEPVAVFRDLPALRSGRRHGVRAGSRSALTWLPPHSEDRRDTSALPLTAIGWRPPLPPQLPPAADFPRPGCTPCLTIASTRRAAVAGRRSRFRRLRARGIEAELLVGPVAEEHLNDDRDGRHEHPCRRGPVVAAVGHPEVALGAEVEQSAAHQAAAACGCVRTARSRGRGTR